MVRFPIEYSEVDTLYRTSVGQGLSLIALTSVEGGEGTTLLSTTLGERAAAAGQKTLLIDLNIANPKLDQIFGCERIDWFPQSGCPLPISQTKTENLFLLSAPKQSACRWEFRDLASLLACFNDLRNHYEVIIIDTSPLCRRNQGNVPSETICACSDGTLLSVLSGKTSDTKVKEATDLLKSVNANLHGGILNDQFSPHLASELIRETYRFNKYLPNLMEKCRKFIRTSTLLNQDI